MAEKFFGALILTQGGEGVVEAGFDGAERNLHGFGNLIQTEAFHEAEQKDFALFLGQGGQGGGKFIAGLIGCLGGFRGGHGFQHTVVALQADDFAPGGDGKVLHRRIQKGLEPGGEGEAGELFQEIEEGFLQDVRRELVIGGEAVGQGDDPIAMAQVQGLERGEIPLVHGVDELGITARAGIVVRPFHPGYRLLAS